MSGFAFSDSYNFQDLQFKNSHYTDNRKGSPLNFVAYLIKGSVRIVSENATLEAGAGELFFIPNNLSYRSFWSGEEIRFLSFGFSELNVSDNARFDLQTIPCDGKLLEKLFSVPTTGRAVSCKALGAFYDMLSDVFARMRATYDGKDERLADVIKQCIRENTTLPLSGIASMCAVSEAYVYSVFRRCVKMTPNEYRLRVICERGAELLVTTDKKLEEIAAEIGLSSAAHFRRVLKKQLGMTPREIRSKRCSV